jgi:hypothetical protein
MRKDAKKGEENLFSHKEKNTKNEKVKPSLLNFATDRIILELIKLIPPLKAVKTK